MRAALPLLLLFIASLGDLTFRQVPAIAEPAPNFSADAVVDGKFVTVSLDDYKGKWLVLLFYPLDFTFVCPTEIISFSDKMPQFRALNTEVAAVSVDSKYSHLAWTNLPRNKGGLGPVNIPLIADFARTMSWNYGVIYKDTSHPLRALYIIDPNGIVRHITLNDLSVGRSVEEAFRLLEAFQHSDANGVVCPAGWKKGDPDMIPDPTDSLKYFSKQK